jgi:hypothetical protein
MNNTSTHHPVTTAFPCGGGVGRVRVLGAEEENQGFDVVREQANVNALKIRVIDVPANVTAEQAERILNEPYEAGYYLDKTFLGMDGAGIRAVYRQRREKAAPDDEAAKAIIQANPNQTVRAIQRALADAGIVRSTGWIADARVGLMARTARSARAKLKG